ncbi:protein FAM91A1-like [Ylistrum balloti]|uniref:protein FAM91A1-like n=1 Tax=Ylistrum balloti TaxID=509963 RepID=UPI002905B2AA|nr:protein FAM91A1-like [Ylistrum balloti]
MNPDIEANIRKNLPWLKLPPNVRQVLGNSQKEYEKAVGQFSVKNQLRYKGNLVKTVRKDEKRYYEEMMRYSQEHLMLYPYHLSDVVVKGLRVTPFTYYVNMMSTIMTQEKSYDSLPNFTAADCLRLLGIGRNQYIDLMNQCRSSKKFFRRKNPKELLPAQPVDTAVMEHWWRVSVGYVTEDDVRMCTTVERQLIDSIIDAGVVIAGDHDYKLVHGLYKKGLIYLDVPIADADCIIVPPLEGFVMNRVLGDYFETLLYKIFVSIDEHTTVAELANVLQIDLQLVKNAVSMYCRLGFAKKKGVEFYDCENLHPSWKEVQPVNKKLTPDQTILDWDNALAEANKEPSHQEEEQDKPNSNVNALKDVMESESPTVGSCKRIAFLFDSTLTAFLMMGNLSPGLKSHAVTMFEVGKLSDESLDSFLTELEKVGSEAEGEARRYFVHALTLRDTLKFLRYNKDLTFESDTKTGLAVDLIRCESLLGLDAATRARVLNRNYELLVSMAPLSYEIKPVSSCTPQHIGPAVPEVNSVWFKLFLYSLTKCGPPSLLLVKGTKLRKLPTIFHEYDKLLVTTWGHDPAVIATSNILLTLNDALSHSAVFVQAHGWQSEGKTVNISFPIDKAKLGQSFSKQNYESHTGIKNLCEHLDLEHTCGYITLLNTGLLSRTVFQEDPDEEDYFEEASNGIIFNTHPSDTESDGPLNGVTDKSSADMLASEIDLLDSEMFGATGAGENLSVKTLKENMTLELDLDRDRVGQSSRSLEDTKEEDWVILECYFGIPLFSSSLNKDVCSKVIAEGLFSKNSLQELLHSSRKVSLRLLNFVSQYQDSSRVGDLNQDTAPDKEETTPLPTVNLLFHNKTLEPWIG